jgi:hypothetical protein
MILKTYSTYNLKRHQLMGLCDGDIQSVSGKVEAETRASIAKIILQLSRPVHRQVP